MHRPSLMFPLPLLWGIVLYTLGSSHILKAMPTEEGGQKLHVRYTGGLHVYRWAQVNN